MLKVKGLQPVWKKSIIDEENTTTIYTVGEPVRREVVFAVDAAWEEGKAHYLSVVYNGEIVVRFLGIAIIDACILKAQHLRNLQASPLRWNLK